MVEPSILVWVKDGNVRTDILGILMEGDYLPSEIAGFLGKHRSSVSRTLSELHEKGLVDRVGNNSRTRLYSVTDLGMEVMSHVEKTLEARND